MPLVERVRGGQAVMPRSDGSSAARRDAREEPVRRDGQAAAQAAGDGCLDEAGRRRTRAPDSPGQAAVLEDLPTADGVRDNRVHVDARLVGADRRQRSRWPGAVHVGCVATDAERGDVDRDPAALQLGLQLDGRDVPRDVADGVCAVGDRERRRVLRVALGERVQRDLLHRVRRAVADGRHVHGDRLRDRVAELERAGERDQVLAVARDAVRAERAGAGGGDREEAEGRGCGHVLDDELERAQQLHVLEEELRRVRLLVLALAGGEAELGDRAVRFTPTVSGTKIESSCTTAGSTTITSREPVPPHGRRSGRG